ncbi:hypothetical protein [Lentzea nigeriaca]|uniref:hypothetical protein n=1 Tax=Lentzea nigeriaca TaxID=1128665 RepID=UPI0019597DD5|nr:hypothetical protein [Lentzea nigeriaca]MBM7863235.1 hypothetical protein [Lentzea nigeriaca]
MTTQGGESLRDQTIVDFSVGLAARIPAPGVAPALHAAPVPGVGPVTTALLLARTMEAAGSSVLCPQ